MALRMRPTAAADAEGRKKLFRATAGLSLQQQLHVATQLHSMGDNVLQKKIQQMKKTSKHQKQTTKENNLKYEWLHEHQHLKKLEEVCTKDLESLLLRIYNDACAERATTIAPASSILKSKKSPARPEVEPHESPSKVNTAAANSQSPDVQQYANDTEALVQLEQDYRVALLKHVASEREQHQAMKHLVMGLRQRLTTASSGASAAVADHMKREAQELIFDAIIGHQMVEGALEEEYKVGESEFQASYVAMMKSLRRPGGKPKCDNQNESDNVIDELVDLLCQGADVDEMMRMEIHDQFQQLQDDLKNDLTVYERDFRRLACQDNVAGSTRDDASYMRGGWSNDDDQKFVIVLKNYERRPGAHKKPDLLYDQVKAVLPHHDRLEIKTHAKFHTHLRFYQEKCHDRQAEYDRTSAQLQAQTKDKMRELKEQEDDRKRKRQQLQQLQQQCAQLHGKVSDWRTAKDAEQRIKNQQDELERLLLEQQKQADEIKWKKRHEDRKAQVEDFRRGKLVGSFVDEMHAQQQREREAEEKAMQSAGNAERVQFRQDEFERKLADDRCEQRRRDQAETERLSKLEAIKLETPYAEKLATIVADPERTRQETAAFRVNVEGVEDGLALHEQGLFPTHGYDCDTLFKNARFKLGIALRNAGLHQTEHARKALANIKVSNAGAYRNAVAPSTQLW